MENRFILKLKHMLKDIKITDGLYNKLADDYGYYDKFLANDILNAEDLEMVVRGY